MGGPRLRICPTSPFLIRNSGMNFLASKVVQRDVTGIEIGLKKSILKSYITGKIILLNLKECHHERSIKPVSASLITND
jgi:hypothetical protein